MKALQYTQSLLFSILLSKSMIGKRCWRFRFPAKLFICKEDKCQIIQKSAGNNTHILAMSQNQIKIWDQKDVTYSNLLKASSQWDGVSQRLVQSHPFVQFLRTTCSSCLTHLTVKVFFPHTSVEVSHDASCPFSLHPSEDFISIFSATSLFRVKRCN